MRRVLSIAALLLLSVIVFAGNEPKLLAYSNTVLCPNRSKAELRGIAEKWMRQKDNFVQGPKYTSGKFYRDNGYDYDGYLLYTVRDCPDFGLPRWIPGGECGTMIFFIVTIECRESSYTARLFNISTLNPNRDDYYGENGQLYPELYNKKQIKNSIPILEYISALADDIFLEIKEYMVRN